MTSNVTLFPLDKYDFNKCIKQKECNIKPKIRSANGTNSPPHRGFNDPRMWASNDGARKLLAVFNLHHEILTAVCSLQRSN
jgi:hypothetical protein